MWQKIKEFISQNSGKLLAFTLSYFVVDLLSILPYSSLVFTTRNKIFIMIILATIILKFRTRAYLVIAIFFLFLSILAVLFSRHDIAENLGTLLYLLMWAIFIINVKVKF